MADFKFNCPHCKQSLEAPEELLGQQINCPSCSGAIQLPKPQPSAPPPPAPVKKQTVTPPPKTTGDTRPCPYCGEAILRSAQKCKHCGEFLKGDHEVKTNVKQGALIGAVACFIIGIIMMFFSLWTFIMYTPLFLAAFVLSIVAMAQKRVAGGILMMLLTVIVPPVLFFGLGAVRGKKALDEVGKSIDKTSVDISKAWDEGELTSVKKEIADLERRKTEAQRQASALSGIAISEAKYGWSKSDFMSEPVIEFRIKNATGKALTRIYFHGKVTTPGRTVPWVDEDFNYTIQGGLESGEEKHLSLAPNQFGPWGSAELKKRDDLVFAMTVVNAEDASGSKLVEDFDKSDEDHLADLRKKQSDLESKLKK